MKRLLAILLLILFLLPAFSQSASKADQLFSNQDYADAVKIYKKLLSSSPKNQLYLYRYARCLEELGETDEAIVYFEKAGNKYKLKHLHLGHLYRQTYRFHEAGEEYEAYLDGLKEDDHQREELISFINYCKQADRLIKRVNDISIIDSVVVPVDDILSVYNLSTDCGTMTEYNQLYRYITERGDTQFATQLFSNGKTSLVMAHRVMNEWAEIDTLPSNINSEYNENYPFLASDGITLYFASDRADGLGGYDIYMTRYNQTNNSWYDPETLGFPFNSPKNDYLFAIDENKGIGYFASDRYSKEGQVTVYRFVYSAETKVFKGDDESTRLRAQLKLWSQPELQQKKDEYEDSENDDTEIVVEEVTQQKPLLHVNDSTVYYSVNDFKTPAGRALYEQYVNMQESYLSEQEALDALRSEYQIATDARKSELKAVILAEEMTLRNFDNELKATYLKMVNLENGEKK